VLGQHSPGMLPQLRSVGEEDWQGAGPTLPRDDLSALAGCLPNEKSSHSSFFLSSFFYFYRK
jgi:hypothetical protein